MEEIIRKLEISEKLEGGKRCDMLESAIYALVDELAIEYVGMGNRKSDLVEFLCEGIKSRIK